MRTNRLMLWALLATLIGVLLNVGCRQQLFSQVDPAQNRLAGSVALPAPGPLPAPVSGLSIQKGTVVLTIQWPRKSYAGFSAQTIPFSTDKIEIQVKQGGVTVQTGTLAAPFATPVPTASATPYWCCPTPTPSASAEPSASASIKTTTTFTLDAGDYDFEAQAYRGSEQIAKANALVTVVGGAENPAYLPLGPLFAPTITSLSAGGGGYGAEFHIFGTYFGTGSTDSVPIAVNVGGSPAVVSRTSPTDLLVTMPYFPGDSGQVEVVADGVAMTTSPPSIYFATGLTFSATPSFGALYMRPGATFSLDSLGVAGVSRSGATFSSPVTIWGPGNPVPARSPAPLPGTLSGATLTASASEVAGSVSVSTGVCSYSPPSCSSCSGGCAWYPPGQALDVVVSEWQPVGTIDSTASISRIFFANDLSGWAVGGGGTILHTSDGGASWTPQNSGKTTNLSAVYFTDASSGIVGGANGLIMTTANGGDTWTGGFKSSLGSVSDLIVAGNGDSAVKVACAGNMGSVFKSADGVDWSLVGYYNCRSFNATGSAIVMRTQYIGYVASDSSLNFVKIPFQGSIDWTVDANTAFGHDTVTDPDTGNPVIAPFKTLDGGSTWTKYAVNPSWVTGSMAYSDLYFADANRGWFLGYGSFLRTLDGGANWTVPAIKPSTFFFRSGTQGWAIGARNLVYKFMP